MDVLRHGNGYGLPSPRSTPASGDRRSLTQVATDLFRYGIADNREIDIAKPGGADTGRVIVVSNRVGLPSEGKARAGGLEVVMRSFIKRNRGIWFGWSGQITQQRGSE